MKYKEYPKYKDSGVEWIGQIPEKWEIKKLKFLVDCIDGKRIPLNSSERSKIPGNYPYFGANGIVDRINDFIFNEPIIILGEDGAPFNEQFKDVAFFVNEKCWINNHAHVLVPIKIEPRFFTNALNCVEYLPFVEGSTREKLTQESMNNIPICVPSVDEQIEISDFIEKFLEISDNLISKFQQQIILLEEKRQATINQAVTKGLDPSVPMKDSGVEWIGRIPKHWEVKKLKFVANFDNSTVDRHVYDDEIPVYISHYPQVYNNEIISLKTKLSKGTCSQKEFENFRLKKDDVLITKDSETADDIGVPVYILDNFSDAVCGYHVAQISTNKNQLFGGFFFRFIQSSNVNSYFETEAHGITRYGLGKDSISNLILTIPPKEEQEEIYDFLQKQTTQLDELIAKSKAQVTLLEEKRQALITAAVTGKIDVRNSVVA